MLVEYMHLVQLHLMILHCFLVRLSMFEFDFALRNHYTPLRYLYMVAVVPNRFYQRCLWMSGMVNSCVVFTPKRHVAFPFHLKPSSGNRSSKVVISGSLPVTISSLSCALKFQPEKQTEKHKKRKNC